MSRPRNICFTLNNYTENEFEQIQQAAKCLRYVVIGREVGKCGTPHIQGYAEALNPKTFAGWKKIISERAHIEPRRGTAQEAADYCKKTGSYTEFGKISEQGKRTDLESVARELRDGCQISEIADKYPEIFIKFHKGIENLKLAVLKDRCPDIPPTVVWLWGKAGVGKTSHIFKKYDINDIYIKDGTMWWNNYLQHKVIVIDDFDGKWPYRDLLRLLDRYPYQGQFKGGYVKINSPFIYITCEFPPEKFWQDNALMQVQRRISEITEVHASDG